MNARPAFSLSKKLRVGETNPYLLVVLSHLGAPNKIAVQLKTLNISGTVLMRNSKVQSSI
jgi:hypothetical protein